MSGPFCAERSRRQEIELAGSASRAEVWFLLEHRGEWRARAVEDNDLSDTVQARLEHAVAATAPSRLLFIRRPVRRRRQSDAFAFFVAVCRERERRLHRFDLARHEDLVELDLPAIAAGDAEAEECDERLILVCANARRDRCCARLGVPTSEAFAGLTDGVWQSTHQGGHRFAAVVTLLPEAIAYGRVSSPDARPVLERRRRGELVVDHLRGRSYYAPAVQAADCFLRRELGETRIDAVRCLDLTSRGDGTVDVTLACDRRGTFRVVVREETTTELVSCSPAKRKTVSRFAPLGVVAVDADRAAGSTLVRGG